MDPLTGYLSGRIIPARAGFTVRRRSAPPEHWDHPRSRGVYSSLLARSSPASGSSPLARGLPPPCTNPRSPRRDHPRSRGVYDDRHVSHRLLTGSSPLARGLPGQVGPECPDSGIIPARAGFTRRRRPGRRAGPDHPRSRGVYLEDLVAFTPDDGSSPLARGLRAGRGARGHGVRWADHPRSRGVYMLWRSLSASHFGSSPLARGLHLGQTQIRDGDGIIPARAGFTP